MENIIYYLVLYLFVIIIRFFKLKRQLKKDFSKRWYEMFFGSLETVYTASGFIIALLLNVPKEWIAVVIVVYLVIVVFSAFLEMSEEDFTPGVKTAMHVIILLIIVLSTIWTFNGILPKVDLNGKEISSYKNVESKEYLVLIPYTDTSIINHIGYQKFGNRYFTYEMKINTSSIDSARYLALDKIRDTILIKPIFPAKTLNPNDILILEEKINVIELIDK